ncbi:GNAT family N-acetyltransferase [Metasolibacillus sp.]|uniref:GNAT family N-acetyltransferase n=1 Tax=Metasolibacillus sp. TaxID=2703680 RepID=UPI0025D05BD9|nr:GNAT family N-acetyltransferase [Metasolibacillus sp.]MCT6925480.1 GNAT family N-acetyltransferase [Metasolibacillus sp.]MCT6941737.1 GNAT family N-acetyltransferase [Metasolibacillus sp.]
MSTVKITAENRSRVIDFFQKHWGSPEMVISSGVYDCSNLDGFIFEENNRILGLVTYVFHEKEVEVISLDSIVEGKGIGSCLMKEVEHFVQQQGIATISLVTTNDNLNALKFYQKRGYKLDAIFPNAVKQARKIKPSIPLVGYNGIPITDEIRLVKKL